MSKLDIYRFVVHTTDILLHRYLFFVALRLKDSFFIKKAEINFRHRFCSIL